VHLGEREVGHEDIILIEKKRRKVVNNKTS